MATRQTDTVTPLETRQKISQALTIISSTSSPQKRIAASLAQRMLRPNVTRSEILQGLMIVADEVDAIWVPDTDRPKLVTALSSERVIDIITFGDNSSITITVRDIGDPDEDSEASIVYADNIGPSITI